MALPHILVDGSENGTSAASKINAGFTQIDVNTSDINTLEGNVTTNTTNIGVLDTRVTSLESTVLPNNPLLCFGALNLTQQTLVSDIPTKLVWMNDIIVDNAGTTFSYSLVDNKATVLEDGIYNISGILNLEVGTNDTFSVDLYKDNLPTGYKSTFLGKGVGKPILLTYDIFMPFQVNDELMIYITSNGNDVTVKTANIRIEKTKY